MKSTNINRINLFNFATEMQKNYNALIPSAGAQDEIFSVKNFDITIDSNKKISSRLYTPTETPEDNFYPMVLFVHGGGWCSGSLETHDVLARALSLKLNAIVLAIDYKLAPEVDAIEQINEVKEAAQWLYNHAPSLKGNKEKLVMVGDSAGGTLVARVAHILKDHLDIKISAQWLMYPAVNFDISTKTFKKYGKTNFPTSEVMQMSWACQLPEGFSENDPHLAPLYADHHNLSRTLISIGEVDPLLSSAQEYTETLIAHGVEVKLKSYENSQHGFIQFYKDKENHPLGEKALNDGVNILKEWL